MNIELMETETLIDFVGRDAVQARLKKLGHTGWWVRSSIKRRVALEIYWWREALPYLRAGANLGRKIIADTGRVLDPD